MTKLDPDAVDRLVDLLTLPVGEADDPRPASAAGTIRAVSEELGSLVFEDTAWYRTYRPQDAEAILEPWFDDRTAADLAAKAADPDALTAWQDFLTWCQGLVAGWRQGEAGDRQAPGVPNPNYPLDQVPGTQFYRYVEGRYLYAATADAPAGQWRAQDDRYDTARPAVPNAQRGYRNGASVLAGTAFYRQLDNGAYVYAPTEYAQDDAWRPYEFWSDQADRESADEQLIVEMVSFLDQIEQTLGR